MATPITAKNIIEKLQQIKGLLEQANGLYAQYLIGTNIGNLHTVLGTNLPDIMQAVVGQIETMNENQMNENQASLERVNPPSPATGGSRSRRRNKKHVRKTKSRKH